MQKMAKSFAKAMSFISEKVVKESKAEIEERRQKDWSELRGVFYQDIEAQQSQENIHARCMGSKKILAMEHILLKIKNLAEKQNGGITLQKVMLTVPN